MRANKNNTITTSAMIMRCAPNRLERILYMQFEGEHKTRPYNEDQISSRFSRKNANQFSIISTNALNGASMMKSKKKRKIFTRGARMEIQRPTRTKIFFSSSSTSTSKHRLKHWSKL